MHTLETGKIRIQFQREKKILLKWSLSGDFPLNVGPPDHTAVDGEAKAVIYFLGVCRTTPGFALSLSSYKQGT